MASLDRFLISSKLLAVGDPEGTVPCCHKPPVKTRAQRRRTRILISVRLNHANPPLHQTPRHLPYISKKSLQNKNQFFKIHYIGLFKSQNP
jgi:hypothetical protein